LDSRPSIGRPDLNAFAYTPRMRVWVSRLLLMLAVLVMIATPLTQHLWTWDNFLHGGQDFETSVLLVLTSLCLLLVLARYGKQGIDLFLAARRLVGLFPPLLAKVSSATSPCDERVTIPLPVTHNLPLQI